MATATVGGGPISLDTGSVNTEIGNISILVGHVNVSVGDEHYPREYFRFGSDWTAGSDRGAGKSQKYVTWDR
ncbi:hypothetical protein E1B28_009510 [Marasmius oreades]|uniref:Uncharacterized protein n=1 Tax=Marasmius oreades TaxID=181124 RepID=A0A9P7URS2_9AGAR|nr:uncharacterized protein E1B28_009510 [Marasmius oreades]KAG7090391.1 hypothetical protein E1B28_009510 [Marasmius oreades]